MEKILIEKKKYLINNLYKIKIKLLTGKIVKFEERMLIKLMLYTSLSTKCE